MSSWSTSLRWMAVFSSLNFLVRSSVGSLGFDAGVVRGGMVTGTAGLAVAGWLADGGLGGIAAGIDVGCGGGVLGMTLVGSAGACCGGCSDGDFRVNNPMYHPHLVVDLQRPFVSRGFPNAPAT